MTGPRIKPFDWIDAFDVGEDSLDRDHHELLDLINEIGRMLAENQESDPINQAMARLLERTERHFRHEEDLMAKHDVPGLAEHRVKHTLLLTQLRDMIDGIGSSEPSDDQETLFEKLVRWFVDHSVKYDAKIKGMI